MDSPWDKYAARLVKDLLHVRRMDYSQLSIGFFEKVGQEVKPQILTNKINRGTFSLGFFLQCLVAMELDLDEVPWETLRNLNGPPEKFETRKMIFDPDSSSYIRKLPPYEPVKPPPPDEELDFIDLPPSRLPKRTK